MDRAGSGLTLYVSPADQCLVYPHPTTVVDEQADVVTITATGGAGVTDCSHAVVTKVDVTLTQPLDGPVASRRVAAGVQSLSCGTATAPISPRRG